MTAPLNDVLQTLRTHESELRLLGVSHAAVFGSIARGEAIADSDIIVSIEHPRAPMDSAAWCLSDLFSEGFHVFGTDRRFRLSTLQPGNTSLTSASSGAESETRTTRSSRTIRMDSSTSAVAG